MAQQPKGKQSSGENARAGKKGEHEQLGALRERLYSRGTPPAKRIRRELSSQKATAGTVSNAWQSSAKDTEANATQTRANNVSKAQEVPDTEQMPHQSGYEGAAYTLPHEHATVGATMARRGSHRKQYRVQLIIGGMLFFVGALVLSILFIFFGGNTISGDNIAIDVDGPFVIGGGEEIPLQIAIANQNAVAVESATLIIEYPSGTQSADEPGRELFRERTSLDVIETGEVLNVPARAVVFGEENEEKEIRVSIEYRVDGSNATFFKEAEPLRFKISSSPVVVRVDAVEEITSGQEVAFDIIVTSNAPTDVTDVLVEAEYPFGFDFSEALPSPIGGQNVWGIDVLEPGEERVIRLQGIVVGTQDENRAFRFSVGVANERDAFTLASIFSSATHDVRIAQAFIDLGVTINNSEAETVTAARDERVQVDVSFENTLPHTIYDVEVAAVLEGNVLDEEEVRLTRGFYDSTRNTVVWNWNEIPDLEEMTPGERYTFSFTLEALPDDSRTPQISFTTSALGKRVSEDRVPEVLTGSVDRTIRFESVIDLSSYGVYSVGPFVNTGPIQPVAESLTQYTITMNVENESNAVTDAEVTAQLPLTVTWLDLVTGGDVVTYDIADREITWDIGDLDAGEDAAVSFQISVLPSISQVGSVPTILGEQRFRATDRFTGTILRDTASALTTRLMRDPDEAAHDGRVRPVGTEDE